MAEKVIAFRTINKPLQVAIKFGEGYRMDTSLILLDQGDSTFLAKGLVYAPKKVFRFFM